MPTQGMPWIKLYTEFLDDPKVGFLGELEQLLLVKLFLLAGECDAEGYLANGDECLTKEHLSWRLRMEPEDFHSRWDALERGGFVAEDDGALLVCKFQERQGRSQTAKREKWREYAQRYRERQAQEHESGERHGGDAEESCERHDSVMHDTNMSHGPREEERREEKRREETTEDGAEAPSGPPTTLDGWLQLVEQADNRPAALVYAFKVLFPGRSPPGYGYIGRVARNVGGAGRLVDLMWRAVPLHPSGDIMRYVQGMAKGNSRSNMGGKTQAQIMAEVAREFEEAEGHGE